MGSIESETTWPQGWEVESDLDRIRRNDKSQKSVEIFDWGDAIEILDGLKNNTVVKEVSMHIFSDTDDLLQVNQEVFVKLSELTKCNKSVESLNIYLDNGLLDERNQVFAAMGTSGGWSSIQELVLVICNGNDIEPHIEPLSLREAEHLSNFIIQSNNLRALSLEITGHETGPIFETLSRTTVQSLKVIVRSTFSLQNGGRQLATALERCTCITELRLEFSSYNDQAEVEFFEILLVESIPKMLGLKKLELEMLNQQFFDMVGQCVGGHQGEIEEVRLKWYSSPFFSTSSVESSSIVGLAPALRRLKVIHFHSGSLLMAPQMGELWDIVRDCDSLEEFGYNLTDSLYTSGFRAICQILSKFPSLKRVTQEHFLARDGRLLEVGRFRAFLEMVKSSKTIEQVPPLQCRNAKDETAIKQYCENNMMHNRIELIYDKGLLAATVPSSAWPLILKEFSDMPDVLYYLLQQKHGAMIGPTRQCCKC
jgi:hypothetical protein